MSNASRFTGIDLIKALATIFVVSVHFFLNTYFYQQPLEGDNMFLQTYLRMLFLICVPLFLITTGFLVAEKTPTKAYYRKIVPVIVIYIFYSILMILFRKYYLGEEMTLMNSIWGIFTFQANSYSWYINMYIGLYLIAPFLNLMYKNIPTKKQKLWLVMILLFMTAVPGFLNGKMGWNVIAAPNYWSAIYPITYYFIGMYIKDYQVKVNKKYGSLALILLVLAVTFLEFSFAGGGKFVAAVGYYASLVIVMEATLFFLLFYDVKINNKFVLKPITLISLLSLDIYLASKISDTFIYKYIYENFTLNQHEILLWFGPIVGATFLMAFTLGYIRLKTIRVR
ncbi:acyltransferase family protein [Bacillus tianshenii]|uniref:acyltransferase n=1 Tax=Sutcliffiella tianshenii TaxID=1463404 RepID=UPI001CD7F767|nr:acyltransferase family protein [Bacillus tianshenii]MCA1320506.1 acyltransferase family protein [Bacillus tianshenii]